MLLQHGLLGCWDPGIPVLNPPSKVPPSYACRLVGWFGACTVKDNQTATGHEAPIVNAVLDVGGWRSWELSVRINRQRRALCR